MKDREWGNANLHRIHLIFNTQQSQFLKSFLYYIKKLQSTVSETSVVKVFADIYFQTLN